MVEDTKLCRRCKGVTLHDCVRDNKGRVEADCGLCWACCCWTNPGKEE